MPFGAEVKEDGTVIFQLVTDAVKTVDLLLPDLQLKLPLKKLDQGRFELTTDQAAV